MKIAAFTQRWTVGGKETYLINNYEEMDLTDLKITILTTKKETDFFDKRLKQLGITIVELTDKNYGPFARPIYLRKELIKHLKYNHYDIIHLNIDNGVGLLFAKVAKKFKIPRIIAHSHNSEIGGGIGRPLKLLSHYLSKFLFMKYPTDYWACSDYAAKWVFSKKIFNNNKYEFMRNGINIKKVRYNESFRTKFRTKIGVKENDYLIGTIGRISHQKNQSFLIDILYKVLQKNCNVKLLIVGEGDLDQELKNKSEQLKIADKIVFYGKTDNVKGALSAMDLFLLPSLFEGFPLSLIEAQANGLPAIASASITKKTQLTQKVRYLSIRNNEEEWVNNIAYEYTNINRENYGNIVQDAGFGLVDTAEHLRKNLIKNK